MRTRAGAASLLDELSVPVVQAPMAGGVSTPLLAGAVAAAGAVGSLGFAYSSAERIAADLEAAGSCARGGPINANFFLFQPVPEGAGAGPAAEHARAALDELRVGSGLQAPVVQLPGPPWFPDLTEQLEPVWDLRPAILSFHFGVPSQWVIERAHQLDIAVAVTATQVDEAKRIQDSGVDWVVAQGVEAGGHRGLFDPSGPDQRLETETLVRGLRLAGLRIPIVAAGGAMDGHDIQRLISVGAAAVQMGTAFLCCPESGASAVHKRLCADGHDRGTDFTTGFSGRPARGIRNRFMDAAADAPVLPFPLQNTMTTRLRAAAVAVGDPEYQSLWAGTGYRRARAVGAGELVRLLAAEWRS